MATRKPPSRRTASSAGSTTKPKTPRISAPAAKAVSRTTVSGPARPGRPSGDLLERKLAGTQALAKGMPYNENKALEYGDASRQPAPGKTTRRRSRSLPAAL